MQGYGPTKGQARAALNRNLGAAATPKPKPATPETFAAVMRLWLADVAASSLAASTQKKYRESAATLGALDYAALPVVEANLAPNIRRVLQVVASERGSGAASNARKAISAVLNLATGMQLVPANGSRGVDIPKPATGSPAAKRSHKPRDVRRALTVAQRDALAAQVDADPFAIVTDSADLTVFLAHTGARLGEALNLTWDQVDLNASTVYLIAQKTDTDASNRTVTIGPALAARLAARRTDPRNARIVFASPRHGGVRQANRASNNMRQVLTNAGHDWATAHTLRRTVATLLSERGVPPSEIAYILGHTDASMTLRAYVQRRPALSVTVL